MRDPGILKKKSIFQAQPGWNVAAVFHSSNWYKIAQSCKEANKILQTEKLRIWQTNITLYNYDYISTHTQIANIQTKSTKPAKKVRRKIWPKNFLVGVFEQVHRSAHCLNEQKIWWVLSTTNDIKATKFRFPN